MTDQESKDVEHEKTKSYELGHISQLKMTAGNLRERAGEVYAQAERPKEHDKAKLLKKLAREFEEEAEEKRERWDEKYDDS